MAVKLDIGTKVSGWITEDTQRVIAGKNGDQYSIMTAVMLAKNKHPGLFRDTSAVSDVRIGFPIGTLHCMPFADTHFTASIGEALNNDHPPYAFDGRTIFTLGSMKTQSIGQEHTRLPERDKRLFVPLIEYLRTGKTTYRSVTQVFSAPDITDVLARWREERYTVLEHNPKGIDVRLSVESRLRFQSDGVTFDGNVSDIHPAARAAVEFLSDRGEGVISISGGHEDYMLSLWAHAQLMRVIVSDYEPPALRQGEAARLVSDLRAAYAKAGITLRPFVPSPFVKTRNQAIYARLRPRGLEAVIS